MHGISLIIASILLALPIAKNNEDEPLISQMGHYAYLWEPADIDLKLVNIELGKTYFHFFTDAETENFPVFIHDRVKHQPYDCRFAYLINTSDTVFKVAGQDGSFRIIREAMDKNGEWKPIEYWVNSFCGNSYEGLEFKPGQGTMFFMKKYHGSFKTQMRLKMAVNNTILYSQPFEGNIEPFQFNIDLSTRHPKAYFLD